MIFKEDGYLEMCLICVVTVLKNVTHYIKASLPLFLARHILLTGVILVSDCTSQIIRALRVDSAGGTVAGVAIYEQPLIALLTLQTWKMSQSLQA